MPTRQDTKFSALLRLLREAGGLRRFLLLAALFFLTAVVQISTGFVFGQLPQLVSTEDTFSWQWWWIPVLILCFVAPYLLGVAASYKQTVLREITAVAYRQRTFSACVTAQYGWLQSQKTGDIIGRVTEDIRFALSAVTVHFPTLLENLLALLIAFILFVCIDWRLAAAFCLPALLLFPAQKIGDKKKQALLSQWLQGKGTVNALMQDLLNNKAVLQIYQRESEAEEKAEAHIHAYTNDGIRAFSYVFISVIPSLLINWLPILALSLTGILLCLSEQMSPLLLTTAIYVGIQATEELDKLPNVFANLPQMLAAGTRLFEVWDAPGEDDPVTGCRREVDAQFPRDNAAGLTLEDVHFAYANGDPVQLALDRLSLSIRPGEHVAVVGPSGCGKSTLLRLLAGLVEPQDGKVRMCGVDITSLPRPVLRQHIGFVPQEPFLFDGTLRENLRLDRMDLTDARMHNLMAALALNEFPSAPSDPLDMSVLENGRNFSGGQRQRISLARTLLYDAPLYLLDEATSSLDSATERQVLACITAELRGKTVIAVCHRLTAVQCMERILVMAAGRIIEDGNHASLMNQNGWYRLAFEQQQMKEASNETDSVTA